MASFIVQLANGQSKQPALGFFAKSVEIDNQGGQYVHIPAIGLFVPPYFEGVAANFPVATQAPLLDTTPPVGLFANPSGNPATLRFTDRVVGVSSGSLNQALLQANANAKSYTVCAGNSDTDTLSFQAATVLVNNPGGQWINITSENATIPPFTVGVVIPLHNATTAVNITTTPPTGQTNTGAGQCATVTYTDLFLPASSGTPASPALSEAITSISTAAQLGPSAAGASFTFSIAATGTVNGQQYRITALSIHVISATAALGQPYYALLTYGTSPGAGTLLWQMGGFTGSGQIPNGQASQGVDLLFGGASAPSFTAAASSSFQLVFNAEGGANWGANQVVAVVTILTIPVTL